MQKVFANLETYEGNLSPGLLNRNTHQPLPFPFYPFLIFTFEF